MDIFLEHIVKKQKTIKDTFINIGIIFLGIFLVITFLPKLGALGPIASALIFYGIYIFVTSRNVEYEYSITNGEIDIDKIMAQRKRKRLLSINCKEFEILAGVHDENYKREFNNINIQKTINAASSLSSDRAYFAIFVLNGVRTKLIFEPTEKMIEAIRKIIPRKVFTK